nr:hypothetical protein [Saprospiraceae bacterium]
MNFRVCLFALLLLVFTACGDDDDLEFSNVPEISLVGISSDTIVEFQDVLSITIEYRDGDGNIGYEDPDINSIFVRDARLEDYDGFYIGPIAPPNEEVPITGQLSIEFPSLFLFGTEQAENTFFYVYIADRDGNESNEVTTPRVTIVRD